MYLSALYTLFLILPEKLLKYRRIGQGQYRLGQGQNRLGQGQNKLGQVKKDRSRSIQFRSGKEG